MDRDCGAPRNGGSKDEQRRLTRDNKFCNSSFLDSGKLFRILAQVIALNSAEFTRVYQDLTGSFEHASESPLNDDFVSKPVSRIRRPLRPLRNAIYPGVDLPCWIEPPRRGRQTIILLGQDPRRDQGYFTVPARKQPYVVIGTPYSVHSRRMTQWHNNQRYWKIIQPLLDAGYNLYLTDIAKFWVRGQKTPPSGAARSTKAFWTRRLIWSRICAVLGARQ